MANSSCSCKLSCAVLQGDIPMNLLATSLMTHAYLYAPADKAKYKTWVLEYLQVKTTTRRGSTFLFEHSGFCLL